MTSRQRPYDSESNEQYQGCPDTKLQQALDYIESGLRVIPLHHPTEDKCSCGRPQCASEGKHPRTSHGVKDATSDREQIERWWTRWPNANIGIATGMGIVVLDLDGETGREWLEENSERVPKTLRVTTGNGIHLYFQTPDGEPIGNRKITGGERGEVLLKGNGGYVVAPPSDHPSGVKYAFDDPDAEVATIPSWILDENGPLGPKVLLKKDLIREPNASPPLAKFSKIMRDIAFENTWEHRRAKELADSSMSGYDLSLASQAASEGWSDQEIADLIISHRRERGSEADLAKVMEHPTYLQTTVARALRRQSARPDSGRDVDAIIHGMTQRGKRDAQYDLHLADGSTVIIKNTMDLMNHRKVLEAIFEADTKLMLPRMKKQDWEDIVSSYLRDIREITPTLTDEEQTEGWVLDALDSSMNSGPHTMEQGHEERNNILERMGGGGTYAFIDRESKAYLHLQEFKRFLRVRFDERIPEKMLAERLSRLGFTRKQMRWKSPTDGVGKRIRLWVSEHPVAHEGQRPKMRVLSNEDMDRMFSKDSVTGSQGTGESVE